MHLRRRISIALVVCAVLTLGGLLGAAGASARDCGTYGTWDDGSSATTDAFSGASCAFAEAAAERFWARDGVPRRLTVRGVRLSYASHRSGASWQFWMYSGHRHGRVAVVSFTQWDAPIPTPTPMPTPTYGPYAPSITRPSIPYPGRGYAVTCSDGWLSHSGGIQGACSHHGGIG